MPTALLKEQCEFVLEKHVAFHLESSHRGEIYMVLSAYQRRSTPDNRRLRHLPNTCREPCEAHIGIVYTAVRSYAGSDANREAPWYCDSPSLKIF
jgi:hypothetical protein